MTSNRTREQIIDVADTLFYQRGYAHTSFRDIADNLRISRGNFYYHFKTKDEILEAVVHRRMANTREMLATWEGQSDTPVERIRCFIRILLTNWSKIKLYGCPVGTLSAELAKLEHDAHSHAAGIFQLFREWLRQQFVLMGRKQDADELALEVLTFSQGVAAIGNAFHDKAFVSRQVEQKCAWLDTLDPDRISEPD